MLFKIKQIQFYLAFCIFINVLNACGDTFYSKTMPMISHPLRMTNHERKAVLLCDERSFANYGCTCINVKPVELLFFYDVIIVEACPLLNWIGPGPFSLVFPALSLSLFTLFFAHSLALFPLRSGSR